MTQPATNAVPGGPAESGAQRRSARAVLFDGLNPEQRQAVDADFTKPCLVLAGAGCGKTACLTRRIGHCLQSFCDSREILALTFTRKAADEMAERIGALPGMRGVASPLVTTFHGFGLRVLQGVVDGLPNAARLGYQGPMPRVMHGPERLEMLAEITSPAERRALGSGLGEIDRLLATLAVHPSRLDSLSTYAGLLLNRISDRFAKAKLGRDRWEFSDMILMTLDLFERFPETLEHCAAKYRHILVDEFQDTNPLQIRLLKALLTRGASLFAVGDDDQAIYGFRGADVGPILSFGEHFEGARVVKLETNYRSTPAVLAAANRIFRDKPFAVRKVLRSGRYGAGGPGHRWPVPRKRGFPEQSTMLDWIMETAEGLARENQIGVGQMAVLFRLNATMGWAQKYLARGRHVQSALPRLLTVHGSKGLEFPVVFLCDLEEGVWPNYRMRKRGRPSLWGLVIRRFRKARPDGPSRSELDEERRLFYVGVTRAEKWLFLAHAHSKEVGGRTRKMEPSRFLRLL